MPKVQYTPSGIKCTEKAHSRRESWDPKTGLTCRVEVYFEWSRRYELINNLIFTPHTHAWPYTILDGTTKPFKGIAPVPVEIECVPMPGQEYDEGCQGIDYVTGIATITYRTWATIRESVEFQTQNVKLEPKLFKWSNTAFNDDARQPLGLDGLSQTIKRLIFVKEYDTINFNFPYNMFGTETVSEFDGSSGLIGSVHNLDYQSSIIQEKEDPGEGVEFVTFKSGTLLMLDPLFNSAPQLTGDPNEDPQTGNLYWRRGYGVKMRWLFRPEGHNKFWRPAKENETGKRGSWETLTMHGANEPYTPFPLKDHIPFLGTTDEVAILLETPKHTPLAPSCPVYDVR